MSIYFGLPIVDDLSLVIPEFSMAQEFYDLIDSDRAHLGQFLDFVDVTTDVAHQVAFFEMKMTGVAKETDKLFLITKKDKLIGCIDLHNINNTTKKAEIGYWIHSHYAGQNIMSKAVNTLCQYAFSILALNKLTIFADVNNIPSNKVAQNAHFRLVGMKPQDTFLRGEYRDMNEYYLLKSDFS